MKQHKFNFKVTFSLPLQSWLLKFAIKMAKTDKQLINDNIMHYNPTQSVN